MSDTVAETTTPAEKPAAPAPPATPRDPLPAPIRKLYTRISGWGFYLATTLIVEAFLFFESTLDVRIYGLEKLREVKRAGHTPLLVIWHGQGLLPMVTFREEKLCLYASHARDPNYKKYLLLIRWWTLRFIERMGYRVLDASVFKSESRGVMQFVDILRNGTGSVIAADGPQGPIYQAKPGPTFLAKKADVVLIPLGVVISGGFEMDQWDRFEIPWPFARGVIVVGEPITVPAKARDAELEAARLHLETCMQELTEEARSRIGFPIAVRTPHKPEQDSEPVQ
ncbi:MAG: hypothetical protein JWN14_1396 [Chthonomonadales bacterium]|nr:hypothetical protein [Chthonomonadales bacterium]